MVAPWSTVQITISNGVVVPNVVGGGFGQSNASSTIRAAGLTVGSVSTNNYDNVSADLVAAQNPPAGTIVAPGSAVAISVSLGPEPGGGGQGGCWVTCP
jgi:beta-lactam-binding protein with PASTA domain